MSIKPIKIYGRDGPNPPKIACLVAELDLPHEIIPIALNKVKEPDYLAINPNGRVPSIYDPNTDITIWESGAIVEYLIERYDTDHKLSFKPGTPEYYHAKQWLFFQTSGQGPYFGQAYWFKFLHGEKIPSAIERYIKEMNRVTGVLEGWLAKQKTDDGDGPWLVGGTFSYADLSFLAWYKAVLAVKDLQGDLVISEYPHVEKWLKNMGARPKIAAYYTSMAKDK